MKIDHILRQKFDDESFMFIGSLRNEKIFNLHDHVFFGLSRKKGEMFRGKIVGVELMPTKTPEYKYKILVPFDLIDYLELKDHAGIIGPIKCDFIFSTAKEAKESALQKLGEMYNEQLKEIEIYFSTYEK